MARENARTKGRRYVVDGRLVVTKVTRTTVEATCRGDGHIYRLGYSPRHGWTCDCAARSDACAHLIACRLVTAVDITDR